MANLWLLACSVLLGFLLFGDAVAERQEADYLTVSVINTNNSPYYSGFLLFVDEAGSGSPYAPLQNTVLYAIPVLPPNLRIAFRLSKNQWLLSFEDVLWEHTGPIQPGEVRRKSAFSSTTNRTEWELSSNYVFIPSGSEGEILTAKVPKTVNHYSPSYCCVSNDSPNTLAYITCVPCERGSQAKIPLALKTLAIVYCGAPDNIIPGHFYEQEVGRCGSWSEPYYISLDPMSSYSSLLITAVNDIDFTIAWN
ncbi:hypothetical protein QOT17_009929 [Balamuthia mandrillaris]